MLSTFYFILNPLTLFAHSPNIAYFTVLQHEQEIEVVAEFPWTIRRAFLKAHPEVSKEKFQQTFNQYIKTNFLLIDDQDTLVLDQIKPLPNEGHSHQVRYYFHAEGRYTRVTNSLMMNLYDDQINWHRSTSNGEWEHQTTMLKPTVEERSKTNQSFWFVLGISMVVAIFLGLFWVKKKRT